MIVMGEFGRSPKITPHNAGREHWPFVFTILMAGAGIPGGRALRRLRQDRRLSARPSASAPASWPPPSIHALGVDPASEVMTMLERPWQICEDKPVLDLW